jgi:hypothetical protein
VSHVLGLGEAGLHEREASLHEEDHGRAETDPSDAGELNVVWVAVERFDVGDRGRG